MSAAQWMCTMPEPDPPDLFRHTGESAHRGAADEKGAPGGKDLNFVDREHEVNEFWKKNDIFGKSLKTREGAPYYTFYDGPPTANGKPHIGHVLTRVIKQIEQYGMEPFIKKCKESVWKYKGMWEDFSDTVGFWADMKNPYVTYYDDYIESEWWALKEISKKGLLYKGFKVVPYCPRCGTPLSAQEVAQGYKLVKERSAIVRFKAKDEDDLYYLAWTTTPWTLPSNVALCVNPDETYVKVKAADGYNYIIAQALADKVLGKLADQATAAQVSRAYHEARALAEAKKEELRKAGASDEEIAAVTVDFDESAYDRNGVPEGTAYEVLETYRGTDLERREYEPLYACAGETAAKQFKKGFYVTCDNYVTMTDGTGIVHIAPAFGEDDGRIGKTYDLPFVQFVDGKGELTEETPYAGIFVKKADPLVLRDLDKEGKLYRWFCATSTRRASCTMRRRSSTSIRTAGDAIRR